ncbi:MAG: metallophosphoesterase [Bacteroidetes bacterium]|uniref:Metallophosphoesterase n=1 Tax=Candidatus Cryptobacteroides excrementavium TaxID=2840759 RepID=A0A9D9J469_9BACT|nr:metallophosphoesterase [Candidatus Cryptobacteroides excrementavium]
MNHYYRAAAFIAAILLTGALSCGTSVPDSPSIPRNPERPDKASGSFSFLVCGDIHWCDEDFYDLDAMLEEKPGDWRQITKTYSPVTRANWEDFVSVMKDRLEAEPEIGCIVQLGDMSEGLANTPGGAAEIAEKVVDVLTDADFGVPVLLAKGNHDITGVGDAYRKEARAAFTGYVSPYISAQVGTNVEDANYVYRTGDVLFVVLDAYNRTLDQTEFMRKALEESDAKYKFVCMHEPAVPATERCWHYLKNSPERRPEFLKAIAENKAVFLCGHLHRYSVLRRNTEWGPVVQVMVNSVTDLKRKVTPSYELGLKDYGAGLVEWKPDYSPSNREWRLETLTAEAEYVDYYNMTNLPGYALISINGKTGDIMLRYYPAWSDEPYDEVNLTELLNGK